MRIWIDTETRTYGIVKDGNLVVIDVQDPEAFMNIMETASDSEISNIGMAFGKPL